MIPRPPTAPRGFPNRFLPIWLAAPLLLVSAHCARPRPVLIPHVPVPVGEGGRILRDLYRSYWNLPAGDEEPVRIGLLAGRTAVRFRALHPMRIRAYAEDGSWEVASPAGVLWKAEALRPLRPPLVTHYAAVATRIAASGERPADEEAAAWKSRGYRSARWVGPPPMDAPERHRGLSRWILSLSPPTTASAAQRLCRELPGGLAASCSVVARVELPPIGRGILSAEEGSFSKEFDGLLELVSPAGPVEILEMVPEERTGETSAGRFGSRLFVVPEAEAGLALVQSIGFGGYLEGVVPAETFPTAHAEALKAQAVVARTYTVRGISAQPSGHPYLLCASTECQVYRGVTFHTPATSAAVASTAGLVLRDARGDFAETFYHSMCGGHTEPRTAVWGPPDRPYLRGVSDETPGTQSRPLRTDGAVARRLEAPATSYCGRASLTSPSRRRWSVALDVKRISSLLTSLRLKPPLTDIRAARRGVSGRVLELLLTAGGESKRIRGEYQIRKALGGLLSSLFVLSPTVSRGGEIAALEIRGAAFGHGVGLCQMGAIGRAEAGQDFREILSAYFPGTRLAPMAGAQVVVK